MNTPQRYRRKPAIVEAIQYQPGPTGNCAAVAAFTGADLLEHTDEACDPQTQWYIPSPAGELCVDPSDWIIRDAQGALTTSKADAFAAGYEPPAEHVTDLREQLLTMATDIDVHGPEKIASTDIESLCRQAAIQLCSSRYTHFDLFERLCFRAVVGRTNHREHEDRDVDLLEEAAQALPEAQTS